MLSAHQDNFYYLNQGECPYVDEVDDGEGFEEMREAMDLVGIMNDEQLMIFRILAGILHIGNIDIQPASEEESTIDVRLCSVFFTLVISVILGPFHTSKKVVYLDKFSVITNILQVWMVCCDLTNFG